jgi:desulfoferrodoxin (superoxide reductase-like protein)
LADVPHDIKFSTYKSGTRTILNITITHGGGAPTSTHYVDLVQVNVSGVIHDVNLTPQSTETFLVEYDLGDIASVPIILVRAHCNVHGWSGWYSSTTIPSPPDNTLIYAGIAIVVVAIIAVTYIFILRRKIT